MKKPILILLLLSISACQGQIENEQSVCKIMPKMFCELYKSLNEKLPPEVSEKIKKSSINSVDNYHLTVGMQIRNQFDLGSNNEITKYFNARGISHPDMMSHVMLQGFISYLNNQPADLDVFSKEAVKLPPPPPPPGYSEGKQ